MHLTRLALHPLRHSLLAALGLVACGPIDNTTSSDATTGTATTAATDPTTGGPTTATPTTDTSATATTTDTPNPTTNPTTATTGEDTTASPDTGNEGTSGTDDTGAPACDTLAEVIDQAFTDPPVPSGFERCNDSVLHRPVRLACETPATPDSCMDNLMGGCTSAADCTDKPNGSCQQDMVFGGFTEGTCSCVYGCATDEDCGQGLICRCAGDGLGLYTECIEAGCQQDSDCPDGELCGLSPDICAPGGFLTACTTPNDLCDGDAACPNPPCMFQKDHWECANAACGRPFVVDCEAVVAPVRQRDDWRALLLAPSPVEPSIASELAAYWTRIGQLEHASVAAFAQFVLQLLAVAAPPELVLAAQSALADEVEHTRLAFGLASLYARTGVGPGPLAIAHTNFTTDIPTLIDAVIREACVGETLAAFEAREAAAQTEVPTVRAALTKIADDELRHAELGWRFVQWALTGADAHAHTRARDTFTAAVAEARSGVVREQSGESAPQLRAFGVVDAPLRAQIWAQGLREVIEPCAAALLATPIAA